MGSWFTFAISSVANRLAVDSTIRSIRSLHQHFHAQYSWDDSLPLVLFFFCFCVGCSPLFGARNSSKGVEMIVVVSLVRFFRAVRLRFILCPMQFYHSHSHSQQLFQMHVNRSVFFNVLCFFCVWCFVHVFHTCNGWPNELNITSFASFFSSSFQCSVMSIVWSAQRMNYVHLFLIWGFVFVLLSFCT